MDSLTMQRVKRILDTLNHASPQHRLEGEQWYEVARRFARSIHPNELSGAGVLAALSPRITWSENQVGARAICNAAINGEDMPAEGVAGLEANRIKAWHIANGDWEFSPLEYLNKSKGNFKVNNFFRNIIGQKDYVTVDTWTAEIAEGYKVVGTVKGKQYVGIEHAYQQASFRSDYSPRDLQAITWCVKRDNCA
jgi:hypothetical protein